MFIRVILILLVLNCLLGLFMVLRRRSAMEKQAWRSIFWSILLAMPFALWGAYRVFLDMKKAQSAFRDWESK